MSVVVWLLMMMMMMMRSSDADPAEIIRVSANSSKSIVLSSGLQGDLRTRRYDVRWARIPDLLLTWNRSTCSDGRCSMLPDGSLEFNRLQTRDSGNYTLEVFHEKGRIFQTKHFLLQVTDSSSSSSSHVVSSVSVCVVLLILLLFFIVVFILRRVQRKTTTGQREENLYVVMKGFPGNKNKEEEKEKKPEKEEEPCVPCSPTVSSQHEDNVYV